MKQLGSDIITNDTVTTKEKEYLKAINFGKIKLQESTLISNEENFIRELKKSLFNKFDKKNEYVINEMYDSKQNKIIARSEKLVFTKLNASESHLFGTFPRISNTKDVLTDIVDNESQRKIDPETIYFEHNTLFYIDFSTSSISFIKTQHIKNVYPFLELFLNNNNFLNVKIFPLIKTEQEIKETVVKSVNITCARQEIDTSSDFVELKKLEKIGCVIKDYKLTVNLETVNNSFPGNLLNLYNKNKKSVKKMSISTLNEDIDLLTNTFTKSVPIKLKNNYDQDYSTIEFTLKNELLKAIQ